MKDFDSHLLQGKIQSTELAALIIQCHLCIVLAKLQTHTEIKQYCICMHMDDVGNEELRWFLLLKLLHLKLHWKNQRIGHLVT